MKKRPGTGPADGGTIRGRARGCQPREPAQGLPGRATLPIARTMSEPDAASSGAPNSARRIDAALSRIEAAVAARAKSGAALQRRHAALKARMAEAVSALDDVIARGQAG